MSEVSELTDLVQIQPPALTRVDMCNQSPNCYAPHFLLPLNVNGHNPKCTEFGEGLNDTVHESN